MDDYKKLLEEARKDMPEHVFNKEKTGQLMAKKIKDIKEAIRFGIEVELDSINYYQEIKRFMPDYQKDAVDKIVEEERNHFLKLSDIKKTLKRDTA